MSACVSVCLSQLGILKVTQQGTAEFDTAANTKNDQ